MIYAVKKFRHYLLANPFVFYVDHQALLYLVNKPCNTGRIVRWFIILLEFDFTVCVRPGKSHMRVDHLSRITNDESPIGIEDDLPDATLFQVKIAPRWAEQIVGLLSIDFLASPRDFSSREDALRTIERYTLISGRLYYLGRDQVLRLCLDPEDYESVIREAHVTIGGNHADPCQTETRILCNGYWWPTLSKDIAEFIKKCPKCIQREPLTHVTLYLMMATPQWANYIVSYLKGEDLNLPKHRQRAIAQEA